MKRFASGLLTAAFVAASLLAFAGTAVAAEPSLNGTVKDINTGGVVPNVCVTIGPPIRCVTMTKADGTYFVDMTGAPNGIGWDVRFLLGGQVKAEFLNVIVNGPTTVNANIDATGFPVAPPPAPPCAALRTDAAVSTNYLPNITKTLGGPTGFQTPFIVQNVGSGTTTLEVSWYRFSDGSCAKRLSVDRAAGTSYAYVPNNDPALSNDSQFAVVVRSFGAAIVSVVNEHQGVGARAEALSYDGFSAGAKNVFLPNITRRFCAGCRGGGTGFVTPFIMQNLGTTTATINVQFVERGSTAAPFNIAPVIVDPGKSKFVDPNSTLGLQDGKAYAVTLTADQPIAVVVNTHDDAPTSQFPAAYSADGISDSASTIYAPYLAKNTDGVARVSTVVVQNTGTAATTASIKFTPLGGGTATTISLGSIGAGKSAAFDPRYTNGDIAQPLCGAVASTGCLADGEYTGEINATAGGTLAAAVNVISNATAMGYTALTRATTKFFLPNVTRTLGGATGWTTPILLQSTNALTATLSWFRFSDGVLVNQQTVPLTAGAGVRVDPRTNPALTDDTQYAVVVNAAGSVVAVVVELATGGDNAMIYEGFPAP